MLTSADVPVSKVRTHSEQLSITSVLLLVEHTTGQLVDAPASLRNTLAIRYLLKMQRAKPRQLFTKST